MNNIKGNWNQRITKSSQSSLAHVIAFIVSSTIFTGWWATVPGECAVFRDGLTVAVVSLSGHIVSQSHRLFTSSESETFVFIFTLQSNSALSLLSSSEIHSTQNFCLSSHGNKLIFPRIQWTWAQPQGEHRRWQCREWSRWQQNAQNSSPGHSAS